jgi:cellulose biosynthesis protein BcsQ
MGIKKIPIMYRSMKLLLITLTEEKYMGKVITVMCTKGGVGKSTLTRYIAVSLNDMGFSTCIIDTCQNSSIAVGFLDNRDKYEKTTYEWLIGEAKPSEVIQQFEDTNINTSLTLP